ncbi:MAG: hypothetical protein CBC83_06680 [Flavobacteriales bacterium TMED123]|nr:MAG: hypothetical protein CBC83_06680 [Flavobacteriales bacterium TMED123]|tara:strand:- start:3912 stop:4379 length:468 start_codon:yes stop_codon:yes gene_type:complete
MRWFPLILLFALFACGSSKKSIKSKVKKEKRELIITLERTACYGTCPIYKIEIYSDGSAFYHGERFVDYLGDYEFSVSKKTTNYILKRAVEIGFFEMEDKYTANITDLPKTIVFIQKDKQKKKIIDYYGAPKKLKEFESLVDGCIDYRRMKKLTD